MTNFEVDTRVPLIVRMPGARANGRHCDRLVEFVDIYPTLCDLAGIPKRSELEGTSFAPLLDDVNRPWKQAAFSQFLRDGIWIAPDGIPYMGYSIRTDRFRYTEWTKKNSKTVVARELYDHADDPLETRNVVDAPKHAAQVARLAAMLHAGWKAAVPPNPESGR